MCVGVGVGDRKCQCVCWIESVDVDCVLFCVYEDKY